MRWSSACRYRDLIPNFLFLEGDNVKLTSTTFPPRCYGSCVRLRNEQQIWSFYWSTSGTRGGQPMEISSFLCGGSGETDEPSSHRDAHKLTRASAPLWRAVSFSVARPNHGRRYGRGGVDQPPRGNRLVVMGFQLECETDEPYAAH